MTPDQITAGYDQLEKLRDVVNASARLCARYLNDGEGYLAKSFAKRAVDAETKADKLFKDMQDASHAYRMSLIAELSA